jgi:hypothetical protein
VYVPVRLAAAVVAVSAMATGCVDLPGGEGDRARPARSSESGGAEDAGAGPGAPGGAFDPRVTGEGSRPEPGGTRRPGRHGKDDERRPADRKKGERPEEAEDPLDGVPGDPGDPGEPAPADPGEPAPQPPSQDPSPAQPEPSPPPPSPDPTPAQPSSALPPSQASAPEAPVAV